MQIKRKVIHRSNEPHTNDKGYFATPLALTTAYPTGQAGWYATVGETDTIWVWDTDTSQWVDSGGGGGSGDGTKLTITQTSHGLAIGEAVYFDGTIWQKAIADSIDTLGIGVVESITTDEFIVVLSGKIIGLSGLTSGNWYYVSDTTPGLLTLTESTIYSNPILQAISATEGIVQQLRVEEGASVRYLNNEVDGGFANSVYLIDQLIDGGGATN